MVRLQRSAIENPEKKIMLRGNGAVEQEMSGGCDSEGTISLKADCDSDATLSVELSSDSEDTHDDGLFLYSQQTALIRDSLYQVRAQ
ncbi:hypothetical protein CYMTET_42681 [Cymbomonas tetramitiformis]|uniref:Uncharacterized protein n=1 Tax=Cymbomonas tetramitiformis TaxID=36881 RepID=A0AAE0C4Y8_9CHLO|nr:hypothetical protein CYMTET_42681 [Cymbomonas tetramitiformis]